MAKYNVVMRYDKTLVNVAAYVIPGGDGVCVFVCVCVYVVRSKQETVYYIPHTHTHTHTHTQNRKLFTPYYTQTHTYT